MTDTVSTIKLAAAQIASQLGDIGANLSSHKTVIDAARSQGVQLLLFPELSLVGHSAGRDALKLALTPDSPVITELMRAAGPMAVAFGLIERDDRGLFYNSTMLVRDGRIIVCHRKVALATYGRLDDGLYFARGDSLSLSQLAPGWRAALGICNDLWQPALVTAAMMQGATLQLAPVSSALQAVGEGFDNPSAWELNLRFNALTWGCPVVMANRVGTELGLEFWGGSRVLGAFGQELACATGASEQLVVAAVDLDHMHRARFMLPTLRDAIALNSPLARRDA